MTQALSPEDPLHGYDDHFTNAMGRMIILPMPCVTLDENRAVFKKLIYFIVLPQPHLCTLLNLRFINTPHCMLSKFALLKCANILLVVICHNTVP